MNERNPDSVLGSGGRSPGLLYLGNQLVNLDRIVEVGLTTERVTLSFAFMPVSDGRSRLALSWHDAEPLLSALETRQGERPSWVALPNRLINLDLAVDIWVAHDQVLVVSAQSSARGGPLPRRWSRRDAQPLLAYFRSPGVLSATSTVNEDQVAWITVGEHLVNLSLVNQVRFGATQVQIMFAGVPRFSRSFAYSDAAAFLERLQRTGILPIEAVPDRSAGRQEGTDGPGEEGSGLAGVRVRRPRRRRWW